jgi:hypothetical protein
MIAESGVLRSFERLSRRQRRATPLPFARWLVERVLQLHAAEKVAVLWVERRSCYWRLWPKVEMWGVGRDARRYAGPWPVICHPPCGPWGKYRAVAHESREHGLVALDIVHRWGGVIEHPVGSSLFRDHGRGGRIERVNQSDWGHLCLKPTLLYWV